MNELVLIHDMTSKGKHWKLSEDTKKKMGLKGEDHPMYGKHLSEEMKKRISLTMKNKTKAEKNPMWKGDSVGYSALHIWIRRNLKIPKHCQICKKIKPLDLMNVTGIYNRDMKNWKWGCRECHIHLDHPTGIKHTRDSRGRFN